MGRRLEELELTDEPLRFTGKIKTARGQLAAFISDLNPKFRRLLVGDALTGWETIDWHELNEEQRAQFNATLDQYYRLLRRVVRARDRKRDRQHEVLADYEQLYGAQRSLREVRGNARRGAPKLDAEQRKDVQRLREVQQSSKRLKSGWQIKTEIKRRRGFSSGDEHVVAALQQAGYSKEDATAILEATELRGAAMRSVARRLGVGLQTMRASVSRATKVLVQA
jgi:transposase